MLVCLLDLRVVVFIYVGACRFAWVWFALLIGLIVGGCVLIIILI